MDRKKALEVLGLPDGASSEDIAKRADVLFKKYKNNDKYRDKLANVEKAYNLLNGIEYYDEKAEQLKLARKENPHFLFKLLKVDQEKALNYIYYYKWHFVISVALIALVVSMVYSIVTQVKPDLKIIIAGSTYIEDTAALENRIKSEVEGVTEVLIQNIMLSDGTDAQMEAALQQKLVVEIAAGENDIYIFDEIQYRRMARQGAVKPVEEVLDISKLDLNPEDVQDLMEAVLADEGQPPNEEKLYGLDITDSELIKESGIKAERLILTFGYQGKYTENAIAFAQKLLE